MKQERISLLRNKWLSLVKIIHTTVVSAFENLLDKINDPLAGLKCKKCGSKNLFIAENDENSALLIVCEKCNYGYLKKE